MSEAEAGRDFEVLVLTVAALLLSAGFAIGWVAHYWVHR